MRKRTNNAKPLPGKKKNLIILAVPFTNYLKPHLN
jgi:hypothetical protein